MSDIPTEITAEILNKAFELGLEFGDNWLQPVNKRIHKIYPKLSPTARSYLDKHINEVRDFSVDLIFKCINNCSCEKEAFEQLEREKTNIFESIISKSPLLNEHNVNRLYSQAIYYSRK